MERLLDVAADMFLTVGFSNASINEIVRRAGGSLSTVYRLFGSKEGLLLAVCQQRFTRIGAEVYRPEIFQLSASEALPRLVGALFDNALDPVSLRMFRLVVAEGSLFPELRARIFPMVMQRIIKPLESYLRAEVERRRLHLDDPAEAAWRVGHLVRAEAFGRLLRGIERPVRPAEKRRMVNEVVAIFWNVLAAPRAPNRGSSQHARRLPR